MKKVKSVFRSKPSIALKKFLKGMVYTAGLAGLSFVIEAFTTGAVPKDWMVYSGIIIAVAQTLKKGLEDFDPKLSK